MKIGMCTEDDKYWNLTEIFQKKNQEKKLWNFKNPKFHNFLLKKISSAFVKIQGQILKKALC